MTATINASTSAGVVVTSDTSGSLALQTANTTAMTINSSQVVNFANAPTIAGSAFPSGAMTLIQSITPTNGQTTIAFTSIGSYSSYLLVADNIQSNNADYMKLQLGYGGTPTYLTSGYVNQALGANFSTVTGTGSGYTGLYFSPISGSTNPYNANMSIYLASSYASSNCVAYNYTSSGSGGNIYITGSQISGTTSAITAFQILLDNGNGFRATGKFSLYGISS